MQLQGICENDTTKIYTAADEYMYSQGVGEINMDVKLNKNKLSNITLKNTLYVKELRNNLISVPQVTKNGYLVIFYEDSALIKKKDGTVVVRAEKKNNLCIVSEKKDSAFQTYEDQKEMKKWDKRYGHLNFYDLRKLHSYNMVKGLKFDVKNENNECVTCAKGKI